MTRVAQTTPSSSATISAQAPRVEEPAAGSAPLLFATLAAVAALVWAYWPVLSELVANWQNDADYSAGMLVLPAALYITWLYRERLARCRTSPSLLGLLLIVFGLLVRLGGMVYLYESLERYGFVIALAGLVLLVAGREVFWTLRWVLVFLLLMVPLPGRVHNLISPPLQELATSGTLFLLELFGITTSRTGNILQLNHDVQIGVVEACSGLRMLTAFVIVAALMAFLAPRPPWQKITVLLSSVPIAVVCNLVRLLVTALLYVRVSSETAEAFFHDFAGILMMPLAVLLLVGELWLLDKLVISEPAEHSNSLANPA